MADFDLERNHVGKGWQPIIEKLHAELLKIDPGYKVAQIKEKFGELRYYFSFSEDAEPEQREQMDKLVADAERQANKTCENCGEPAKTKLHRGWYLTLCDTCGKEREATRALKM